MATPSPVRLLIADRSENRAHEIDSVLRNAGIALIVRESLELNAAIAQCLDAGYTCWPVPSAFVRYAIYAFIALGEVIALFTWSLRIETRMRNRLYAPEWR